MFLSGCVNFHSISTFPGCYMDQVEHMLYENMQCNVYWYKCQHSIVFDVLWLWDAGMHVLNGGFTQIKLGSLKELECKVTSKLLVAESMRRWEPWEEQPLPKKVAQSFHLKFRWTLLCLKAWTWSWAQAEWRWRTMKTKVSELWGEEWNTSMFLSELEIIKYLLAHVRSNACRNDALFYMCSTEVWVVMYYKTDCLNMMGPWSSSWKTSCAVPSCMQL